MILGGTGELSSKQRGYQRVLGCAMVLFGYTRGVFVDLYNPLH